MDTLSDRSCVFELWEKDQENGRRTESVGELVCVCRSVCVCVAARPLVESSARRGRVLLPIESSTITNGACVRLVPACLLPCFPVLPSLPVFVRAECFEVWLPERQRR